MICKQCSSDILQTTNTTQQATKPQPNKAGHPCVDWSSRGSGKGLDGESCAAFLAFVALRMLIQEQHVITENVAAFIIAIYKEFLGNIYHIDLEETCIWAMTYGDRI